MSKLIKTPVAWDGNGHFRDAENRYIPMTDIAKCINDHPRLATVEADALRLRNALEIYANEENWLCEGCESGVCLDHQPRIWGMRPELGYVTAREALTPEVKADGR